MYIKKKIQLWIEENATKEFEQVQEMKKVIEILISSVKKFGNSSTVITIFDFAKTISLYENFEEWPQLMKFLCCESSNGEKFLKLKHLIALRNFFETSRRCSFEELPQLFRCEMKNSHELKEMLSDSNTETLAALRQCLVQFVESVILEGSAFKTDWELRDCMTLDDLDEDMLDEVSELLDGVHVKHTYSFISFLSEAIQAHTD
ncbi:hypothetical protein GUITHDRAFT_154750 [Guillardia theta CCMP2712]|uniref:Uncharacterized protein n=1 Tax=Guillardia theta (strain CCMP2712) TaxID=905079 RepID=L1IQ56_GUITC|nr:hypothetical protein GUITHDRAFT_154750 [Guillardia theta CCMP2712]EKX38217.1 hypothetical protein GUITHDRAFT_154750 [Guillardia theta CCMP2712]|mmetsp:Transcript_20059/g.66740  ORF Transcript_20059/g.66740 Transcript_20059/m.66740 type:complete len:204 (+) Transcript_20059:2134-2745(+)|eukprot:XP_005825197.1 hypothetical protein GUITHDRAFT_154750 [Guillardia theta CCMP2712]